jgi:enoyl-CoA hydratase/carnithine racemase
MSSTTVAAQIRLNRVTPSHCRVVLDNPPLNLMGPEFVLQIRDIVTELENDDRVKVVVFESAVDGFFLNHSDFLANFEDLTSIPQGPTGLEAWPDVLVRLTRANSPRRRSRSRDCASRGSRAGYLLKVDPGLSVAVVEAKC